MKRGSVLPVVALALSVAAALVSISEPARADEAEFYAWPASAVVTYEHWGNCTASAAIWVLESGISGINRFSVEFQRRGPNDPGNLPTYGKVGWFISADIPDNLDTYYWLALLPPDYMNFPAGKSYDLWFKAVGERDSFWQRDLVIGGSLGEIGCDVSYDRQTSIPTTRDVLYGDLGLSELAARVAELSP